MLHFKKPNRKHFNSLKDCNRLIEFRLTTNLNSSSIMNNGIPWITSFPQTMWTQGREMSLGIITKSLLSASAFTRFRTYQFIFYQDYCQEARRKEKKKKKACIRQLHVCHSFYWLDGLDREKKLTLEIAVHLITSDIRMQSAGAY